MPIEIVPLILVALSRCDCSFWTNKEKWERWQLMLRLSVRSAARHLR